MILIINDWKWEEVMNLAIPQTEKNRDSDQPNPGWGSICEVCANRRKGNLDGESFPCKAIIWKSGSKVPETVLPNLVRYRLGDETEETCSDLKRMSEEEDDGLIECPLCHARHAPTECCPA